MLRRHTMMNSDISKAERLSYSGRYLGVLKLISDRLGCGWGQPRSSSMQQGYSRTQVVVTRYVPPLMQPALHPPLLCS